MASSSIAAKPRQINEYFTIDAAPTVKIFVGKGTEQKMWVLPEELVCDRAQYFKAAFKGGFKEGISKELYLEDEEPALFAMIVDRLFSDSFDPGDDNETSMMEHLKLFILADKLSLDDLKDSAMNCFKYDFEQCLEEQTPPTGEIQSVIQFCYKELMNADSSLEFQKILVDELMWFFCYARTQEEMDVFNVAITSHQTFGAAMMNEIAKHIRDGPAKCVMDGCVVHNGA